MPPGGGSDVLWKQHNPADCAQTLDNLQVLHQGDIGKTTDSFEAGGAHKIRLVSGKNPAKARTQVGGKRYESISKLMTIETKTECATDHILMGSACSIAEKASRGSKVSACKKISTSQVATVAPAFICMARPRGAWMTLPKRWAMATV